ncbi:hypothetical protein TrLO_g12030 [Triparma laevis f. longispina]|uniref:Uncharacterized protein n=1 Tax=Triparma laevis f. longispina TaxID=1714387 RepID=A0A9W7ASZ1_9STRA|nr:hypothetical protein TrLO_g12030 [Triparma laevis f. longispina]
MSQLCRPLEYLSKCMKPALPVAVEFKPYRTDAGVIHCGPQVQEKDHFRVAVFAVAVNTSLRNDIKVQLERDREESTSVTPAAPPAQNASSSGEIEFDPEYLYDSDEQYSNISCMLITLHGLLDFAHHTLGRIYSKDGEYYLSVDKAYTKYKDVFRERHKTDIPLDSASAFRDDMVELVENAFCEWLRHYSKVLECKDNLLENTRINKSLKYFLKKLRFSPSTSTNSPLKLSYLFKITIPERGVLSELHQSLGAYLCPAGFE